MPLSDHAELRAFAAVLRHGSFTRAAAQLGVSPSALSQTLRRLEDRLGQRLLHRTTRSVAPTEAGARLAARLLPALEEIEAALRDLRASGEEPAGRLRINATRLAMPFLAGMLPGFLAAHPRIRVEIVPEDSLVDIVRGGFDAGIRLGEVLEGDMIAVPIGGPLRMLVLGAPAYLERAGTPAHPRDLLRHPCAGLTMPTDHSPYRWEFEKDGESLRVAVEGPLVCNIAAVRLAFARAGLGLTFAFEQEAAADLASGALVAVLPEWTPPFPGLHLYYPSRRLMPPALRAFIAAARADARAARPRG
ncbi:transcriptional regulator, LysR family [Rubellimicrobium thermophilum DSM 16684]|uniref:Transcriptional regulator, LysR family n=1 Tax=Rubellimicrobium thermophilum DSM 16684 TaxID=1123069 RepID=S9SM65_9RHOB|nr:LysR family transcriptional regulator [Rubellimicrobium thermophilum]EPX87504.1 transcriptional regulator, LysR family [Rubellimicrobium thermophilum DSM 16684]